MVKKYRNIIQECNYKYSTMTLEKLNEEYGKVRSNIIPNNMTIKFLKDLTRFEMCIIYIQIYKTTEKLRGAKDE